MSVLLLTEVFPPRTGGSGRWFWEIYRRLPREDVVVVAGEDLRQGEFDRTHDLRVSRMPLSLPSWGVLDPGALWGHFRIVPRLGRLTRSVGVAAVHCGKCLPEGLMALELKALAGLPYLCYVHGEEMNIAARSRELTWLTRRVLQAASGMIANSHNTAWILRDEWGVPADAVAVLHPGVDTERFVPAPADLTARAGLGWGDRPVVLTVGRLQKRKGHDRMIEALPAIRAEVPRVLYSILGDGDERAALEGLAARLGVADHVQFLGECDEATLLHAYQQCDLFILPNRRVCGDIEGFGMVLVEAQACGKPVIAGASGGTAETLREPETGLVLDCDDPARIATGVADLLADRGRLAAMGGVARRWAVERFDWEALVRRAGELFREGIRGRPGGVTAS